MKLLRLMGLCTKNTLSKYNISTRSEMQSVFQRQKPIGHWGKKSAVRAPGLNATAKRESDLFNIDGSQADAKKTLWRDLRMWVEWIHVWSMSPWYEVSAKILKAIFSWHVTDQETHCRSPFSAFGIADDSRWSTNSCSSNTSGKVFIDISGSKTVHWSPQNLWKISSLWVDAFSTRKVSREEELCPNKGKELKGNHKFPSHGKETLNTPPSCPCIPGFTSIHCQGRSAHAFGAALHVKRNAEGDRDLWRLSPSFENPALSQLL